MISLFSLKKLFWRVDATTKFQDRLIFRNSQMSSTNMFFKRVISPVISVIWLLSKVSLELLKTRYNKIEKTLSSIAYFFKQDEEFEVGYLYRAQIF